MLRWLQVLLSTFAADMARFVSVLASCGVCDWIKYADFSKAADANMLSKVSTVCCFTVCTADTVVTQDLLQDSNCCVQIYSMFCLVTPEE